LADDENDEMAFQLWVTVRKLSDSVGWKGERRKKSRPAKWNSESCSSQIYKHRVECVKYTLS